MSQLFRIAPTPSGFLHIGNAFNFLLVEKLSIEHQARIFLRMDDLDKERSRPEYVQDIFDTLHWLGIEWHMGPQNAQQLATWSQQRRLPLYASFVEQLKQKNLVFPCTCSRKMQENAAYNGHCLHEPPAPGAFQLRAKTPDNMQTTVADALAGSLQADWTDMRYFVVQGKNGKASYQVASVVDDVHFGVTDVVRGIDLLSSTAAQCWLADQCQLGGFQKINFYHHPLLQNAHGEKISKSAGDLSLQMMRNAGETKEGIRSKFQQWLLENGL